MRVTVDRDGVTVVLPQRAIEHRAQDAIIRLEPWIRKQLAERELSQQVIDSRGMAVPWLGELVPLVPQPGRKTAHRDGGRILVPDGDHRPALERLIRREAKPEFAQRLDRITAECGHQWTTIRIGDMKTRWASCSPGGRFSFSWRLMLAPDQVLETVVWHEVCHVDIADHSPRFWALLEQRRPGHKADHQWLADHGQELAL